MEKIEVVRPSFLEGMARTVDIGGVLQDRVSTCPFKRNAHSVKRRASQRLTSNKVIAEALAADWASINRDLGNAANHMRHKYKDRLPQ